MALVLVPLLRSLSHAQCARVVLEANELFNLNVGILAVNAIETGVECIQGVIGNPVGNACAMGGLRGRLILILQCGLLVAAGRNWIELSVSHVGLYCGVRGATHPGAEL